ncbi:MBL fold metallo-hydrolase [Streptomyces sp. NPDC002680]|uniref:MBL fold metallo-hydrolase n=1 Tax=Streptomyces sp. NPDC002680 TaxID=3364659 RepID=UPI0036A9866A
MTAPVTASGTTAPPRLQEVAENIYAYLQPDGGWCLSNSGIFLGRDSVAIVDTAATESRGRGLREAVRDLTPVAPRTVINTHHHGDHTFGNWLFAPEATVVAHELARTEMAEKGTGLLQVWPDTDWGRVELALPTVTFEERLTLYVDGTRVELIHVGPAHTTNDIVVWVPEHRLLFAGDVLMPGCTPFVLMGSVRGSLDALERLRALGPRTVVGGHGEVSGPEAIDQAEAYLRWIRTTARAAVEAGLEPLEAALESDLGEHAGLRDPERVVANLHRACSEERGHPIDTQIRSGPVFAEMVRYNGGRPLTCLA